MATYLTRGTGLSLQVRQYGDIDNITLPLQHGVQLNGRISIEGLSPSESAALTGGLLFSFQRILRHRPENP